MLNIVLSIAYVFILHIGLGYSRTYGLKKCKGPGCPYTASWLVHVNLYRSASWYVHSTKMEEASFRMFYAPNKYQLENPHAYFVHHLSEFEHLIHKKYGIQMARNMTEILTNAAYAGECTTIDKIVSNNYIAIIPFYGGLPPNVTSSYTVKSIGQGNSLVTSNYLNHAYIFLTLKI